MFTPIQDRNQLLAASNTMLDYDNSYVYTDPSSGENYKFIDRTMINGTLHGIFKGTISGDEVAVTWEMINRRFNVNFSKQRIYADEYTDRDVEQIRYQRRPPARQPGHENQVTGHAGVAVEEFDGIVEEAPVPEVYVILNKINSPEKKQIKATIDIKIPPRNLLKSLADVSPEYKTDIINWVIENNKEAIDAAIRESLELHINQKILK